jgi:HlyD family secretion protein
MGLRSVLRFGVVLVAVALFAVAAWTRASRPDAGATAAPALRVAAPPPDAIACLGRIQPEDGVVRLAARSLMGQPSIVAEIRVAEGDRVRHGDVLAVLNSRDQLEAAWRAAEARSAVATARLAQVKAGAKPADLQAQRAEIGRLEAEDANAVREYGRFQDLHREHVVSDAELDAHRVRAEAAGQLLAQARERLNSLSEVRDVDVAYAQAELQAAVRAARQARAEFDQAEIRAPFDGRVIAIHARPGAEAGPAGIMEIAKTDRMYAVAEVDVNDLAYVKVGERASVSGSGLDAELTGVVERIGLKITANDERNVDPLKASDARVVETRIRLDQPEKAAALINAQVTVRIARMAPHSRN